MSDVAMFDYTDARPPLVPIHKAPRTAIRPVWTDYASKSHVMCDDCQVDAPSSLRAHSGYKGMAAARHKRSVKGESFRLYCHEHARGRRAVDEANKA